MEKTELRKQLEIRPVEMQHLEQFNELLRYVFQVTSRDLIESGYEEDELLKDKRPVLSQSDVLGWFKGEQLISQLAVYPCQVNIHGEKFKMAGLTGVGTYPEYANLGLMHDLIKMALQRMREHEQYISYLFPYSIPFYRHKGWEIMSDKLQFTLKDTQLPKIMPVNGTVERQDVAHVDVLEVYQQFSENNHGAMIRNQLNWDEYWRWENEEERTAAVYYDENNRPTGFIFYWIAEEIFHIKEMVYLNQEARKGLWNFIAAHFSMITEVHGSIYKNEPIAFLMEDSDIKETIAPYFMARIVDVEAFLLRYPFAQVGQPFHFELEDPLAEWNNGIFGVYWDQLERIHVTHDPVGQKVVCDIQTLTTMLMSYRRPSYLAKIERLAANRGAIKNLENIIPNDEPYFSDYF